MALRSFAVTCALGAAAHADPELDRIATVVRGAADEAASRREANVAAGAIAGVGLVPVGVAMTERSDPASHSVGIGMIFGGGVPLLFSGLSLWPSPIERFAAAFEARRAAGMADAELVEVTRREWGALAASSRASRIRGGVASTVVGVVASVVGIVLLRGQRLDPLSHDAELTTGSVLLGAGVPFIQLGVRALLQRSPEELWWSHLGEP